MTGKHTVNVYTITLLFYVYLVTFTTPSPTLKVWKTCVNLTSLEEGRSD